ncbi:MAG: SWIM zinc finger family protein, partial [Chloroflexota bacterium]|nr:SWIM zinc finger family protein [Chloroflexota bacterium]
MSDWSHWGRYVPAKKKKPAPAHGIKMKKAGPTWWGQRWIEALGSVLGGDSARLARGRTYARAGRAHDLVVSGGTVTAKVTGSRATPYKITIALAQLPDAAWKNAIAGMAVKAQFAAELLAGQMPKEIDDVFRSAGSSLFPEKRTELVTSCSCPDWGDPCKHVAATHYVLGEALDRDPFLLFELRGRTKPQVLDALRVARGGEVAPAAARRRATKGAADAERVAAAEPEVSKVALGKIAAGDYDRARGALPALHFSFDAPITHGAVLRQLGAPGAWSFEGSPADTLS